MSGRWNIEEIDGGIRVCRGEHERSAGCEWVEYVPKAEIERLEAALLRIIEAWDGDSESMHDDPAVIARAALEPNRE